MRALVDDPDKHHFAAAEPLLGGAGLADQRPSAPPLSTTARGSPPSTLEDQVLVAPDRDKEARRVAEPLADPAVVAATQPGPLEARCGIIIVRSHAAETGTSVAARASRPSGHR